MDDSDLDRLRRAYLDALNAYLNASQEVRVAMASLGAPLTNAQVQWCADRIRAEDQARIAYEAARNAFLGFISTATITYQCNVRKSLIRRLTKYRSVSGDGK
jgi:hypothetical protein